MVELEVEARLKPTPATTAAFSSDYEACTKQGERLEDDKKVWSYSWTSWIDSVGTDTVPYGLCTDIHVRIYL